MSDERREMLAAIEEANEASQEALEDDDSSEPWQESLQASDFDDYEALDDDAEFGSEPVGRIERMQRHPLQQLDKKEAGFQAQLSAFGTLKSSLTSFQTAVKALNDVNKFQAYKASIGATSVATVTAANSAVPGSYSLEVTQLAQAQKLVAAGQTSTSSAIGSGTITFEFGTVSGGTFDETSGHYTGAAFSADGAGAKTVTIDASNNTLAGTLMGVGSRPDFVITSVTGAPRMAQRSEQFPVTVQVSSPRSPERFQNTVSDAGSL